MKCPNCKHEYKDEGRAKGGRAKVAKGFADPRVQAKAQAARRRKAEDKRRFAQSEKNETDA